MKLKSFILRLLTLASRCCRCGRDQVLETTPSSFLIPLPELAALLDVVTLMPESYSDWPTALAANANKTDFLLEPGDYTSWGLLTLDEQHVGTPERKRVIRSADITTPPWQRAPEDEVIIEGFHFGDTSGNPTHDWILHGITIRGSAEQNAIWMGSHNVVVDSVLIEDGTGPYGIRILLFAHDNAMQRSVIRNPAVITDGVGIQIRVPAGSQGSGTIHNNRIVNNQIYNYTDPFAITQAEEANSGVCDGTIVDRNDLYTTSEYHTQGGMYALTENAIDLKGGSGDPNNPVRIANNRMYGFRFADTSRGPSGSDGVAMTIHFWAKNIVVEDNIVFDCPGGVRDLTWPPGTPDVNATRNIVYRRNVFHGIQPFAPEDTGYVWKVTVPETFEDNVAAHCAVLQGVPGVQVGDHTMNGNTAINCPLGEATEAWATGVGNRVLKGGSPLVFQVEQHTGPRLVSLPDGRVK